MKYFILLLLVFTATLHAQNPKPAEKKVNDFAPNQREFFNLPEEKRKEFIKHYDDAIRFFADKRVFETLDALDEAEKVFSKSMELHNMRGSCYIEMRIFDKANISFNKALEISPNNLNLKFNIAECFFVSKKWQDSHDKFQELVKILPPNSGDIFRLAEFKLLLCKKKLGLNKALWYLNREVQNKSGNGDKPHRRLIVHNPTNDKTRYYLRLHILMLGRFVLHCVLVLGAWKHGAFVH